MKSNAQQPGVMTVAMAIKLAVEDLPDQLDRHAIKFDEAIARIQNAIGQTDGGPAGMYFDSDEFFEKWKMQNDKERFNSLLAYAKFEISYLVSP